jgi:AraC-like DNA-binding protein
MIETAFLKCGLAITESNLLCILAQKEFSAAANPVDTYAASQTLKTLIGVIKNYGEGYGCIVDNNLFCLVVSLPVTDQFFKNNPCIESGWSRSQMLLHLNTLCRKPADYSNYILKLKDNLIADIRSGNNYNTAISRAQQFIRQNFARDLSLEEVAAEINLAPAYFSRLFSQVTGTSFINYLTEVRIRRAKELLQGTNAKIKEINETVGYSNIYYFSRVFKNKTGVTPIEYRRQIWTTI